MLRTQRTLLAAMLAVALVPVGAGVTLAADPSIVLRLATPETEGRPSEAFLQAFKSAVEDASAGDIAVDIVYRAGGDDNGPKERIVADRILSGDVEMGLIPVRAWNDLEVTAFQALAAPLLIDSDALAVAVARDPLVQPMLDAVADVGLEGLAVWPEDLRHPFTYERNGTPLLAPDDFPGAVIGALPSVLTTEILAALGATTDGTAPVDALVLNGKMRGVESGLWQGAYTIGGGLPTATADVTLFPKYQVLVAEDSAWSRLSAEQQRLVREAAITARDTYLAARPDDVANGVAYCAAGGKVVHAGAANIAAFREAVQPVVDRLASDPLTASAIAAIQALKDATSASPVAEVCIASPDAAAKIPPVEKGPAITLIPDGTYVQTISVEDHLARGTGAIYAQGNAGEWRWTFHGDTGTFQLTHLDGNVEACSFSYKVIETDRVRQTGEGACAGYWVDLRWTLEGDQLRMVAVDEQSGLAIDLVRTNSTVNGPLTKIE